MTVKLSRADRPRPTAPVLGRQKGVRSLAPETFFGKWKRGDVPLLFDRTRVLRDGDDTSRNQTVPTQRSSTAGTPLHIPCTW
jgi:hypothetical protein